MFRVARGGATWLIVPIVLAILCLGLAGPLGLPWLVDVSPGFLFVFMLFLAFFRDPERTITDGVASPADGKVVKVDEVDDPDIGPASRVSIFMRPQDVHVNRAPLEGDVRSVVHTPGKHVPAFSKDSDRNERVTTMLRTELGDVKVIQIAGAVARRIYPYIEGGEHLARGERFGLIRLGSRCDVLVPQGAVEWQVELGQRVYAGSTRLGIPRSNRRNPPAPSAHTKRSAAIAEGVA